MYVPLRRHFARCAICHPLPFGTLPFTHFVLPCSAMASLGSLGADAWASALSGFSWPESFRLRAVAMTCSRDVNAGAGSCCPSRLLSLPHSGVTHPEFGKGKWASALTIPGAMDGSIPPLPPPERLRISQAHRAPGELEEPQLKGIGKFRRGRSASPDTDYQVGGGRHVGLRPFSGKGS